MRISIAMLMMSLMVCSGCSFNSSDQVAQPLSVVRNPLPGTRQVKKTISRKDFWGALEQGGDINRARLVEVFSREKDQGVRPEYRLFDVQEGSVYSLLGLKPLDILVSANDYSVPSGGHFWQYLQLLRYADRAKMEIHRDGVPIVFSYTFINDLPEGFLDGIKE